MVYIRRIYPPVIKHGLLENPPCMDNFPSQKPPLKWDFPLPAMFDHQRVYGSIYPMIYGSCMFIYGVYIYIYIHMCIYIYICIYIYMCIYIYNTIPGICGIYGRPGDQSQKKKIPHLCRPRPAMAPAPHHRHCRWPIVGALWPLGASCLVSAG